MDLEALFKRCISIEYTNITGDGSYAYEKLGDTLYIYFEGSNGIMDWQNNLNFPIKAYKGIYVHRGFLLVWKSLEPYIKKAISDTSPDKIILVGYSHGGALAVLCHEYIWYNYPALRSHLLGYGFGAPRVVWGFLGDKAARWESFTVVRNIDDIVTHLPPSILGYRHVGRLLEIGKRKKYSMTDAHREENILAELHVFNMEAKNSRD